LEVAKNFLERIYIVIITGTSKMYLTTPDTKEQSQQKNTIVAGGCRERKGMGK